MRVHGVVSKCSQFIPTYKRNNFYTRNIHAWNNNKESAKSTYLTRIINFYLRESFWDPKSPREDLERDESEPHAFIFK